MSTGTILPFPIPQFSDSNGNPLSGGKLYSYAAGTTTPSSLYTDVALTIAYSNPLILDSSGQPAGPIYAALTSYKLILTSSADATIWTADNVASTSVAASQATDNSACQGRITLTSGTPVTIADVTAATTVYFTPYGGNKIALYDGSAWNIRTFAELSLALGTDTTGKNYDLFALDTAGVVSLERLVWTNDTTRATALTTQDGVYVKTGALTRRYLGTYRTTGAGQTEDSFAKRFVWNYAKRVPRTMRVTEATNSWTYTTNSWRQANNSTANQLAAVIGVAEVEASLEVLASARNSSAAVVFYVAIGHDSVTVNATGALSAYTTSTVAGAGYETNTRASFRHYPAVGYHYWAWLEASAATGTTTWYGDDNGAAGTTGNVVSGIVGVIAG